MTKHEREEIAKIAKERGYQINCDGTKLVNPISGGTVRFSDTGGSVYVNGSHYNNASDPKKSKSW